MSTTPYRRTTSAVRQEPDAPTTINAPRINQPHLGTSALTPSRPIAHPSSVPSLPTTPDAAAMQRASMAGTLHTPKASNLYTPLVTPFAEVQKGTPGVRTGFVQPFGQPAAPPPQTAAAFSTPIPVPPATPTALPPSLIRPLSSRQPPGSLSFVISSVPEDDEPLSSRRHTKAPPVLTLPSGSTTPAIQSLPITPAGPTAVQGPATVTTTPAAAPVATNVAAAAPILSAISAPVSTVKGGDSSTEPSLTDNRRNSASSNDNSLVERVTTQPAAAAAPSTLQPQKPLLPPLTNPPAAGLAPPTMPYPMYPPPPGFPFGAPMMPPPGMRPGMPPGFPGFNPFGMPVPVNIVSYNGVPIMPPPGITQPQAQPQQPVPSKPAPSTAVPAPQHAAMPGQPNSPSPVAAAAQAKSSAASLASPRPASPSVAEQVVLEHLKTLDSRPTLTELELAGEKRSERDVTMFWLWLLCALTMVSMAFHLHRYSYDKILYLPFASGALGLSIISFILIVIPIGLIFLGRTIYERIPTTLLFHALLCLLVSFVLYAPILVKYLPRSTSLAADTAFALELAAATGRFSSGNTILAALILHACALGVFYIVVLRILAGERRFDESFSENERGELHAALLAVQGFEEERRNAATRAIQHKKHIQTLEDQLASLRDEKNRELALSNNRMKVLRDEKEQLESILDGLQGSKDLDGRQKELFHERAQHLQANHLAEMKKLLGELQERQTFQVALQKELTLHQDQLQRERARVKAAETELGIIKVQMNNAGLEQSRIIGLQEQLARLTEEYNKNFLALEKSEAQLLIAKQGKCIHCESTKEKYEHLRNQHLAQAKIQEENATLKLAITSLKQQLLSVHKRNLQLEQRTRKKIDQITHDLEDFDQFTHKIEEEK